MARDEIAIADRQLAQEARIRLAEMRATYVVGIPPGVEELVSEIELRGIARWSKDAAALVRLWQMRRSNG